MGKWSVEVALIVEWLDGLDRNTYRQVSAAIEILSDRGPALGRPLVDSVVGSIHKNMKELRPGSTGRTELRVLFIFDPKRRAIMLVAGDKSGEWDQWYRTNVPIADSLYDVHLERIKKGEA